MTKEVMISLCDITGTMAEPWLRAGYDVILVDPQHGQGVHVEGIGAVSVTKVGHIIDAEPTWELLRSVIGRRRVAFMAAFPPCTDLAVSGARWFDEKRAADPAFQFKAMHVVWQCHVIGELVGAPYLIENPVSQISSFWRKPDHSFHPYEFTQYAPEDNYTKKTCLWTGGGFIMPQPRRLQGLGEPDNRIHTAVPGPERANYRSATPKGFAKAVFSANCGL